MFIEESIHRQSAVPSHYQLKVTLEDKVEKEECSEGDLITPVHPNFQKYRISRIIYDESKKKISRNPFVWKP